MERKDAKAIANAKAATLRKAPKVEAKVEAPKAKASKAPKAPKVEAPKVLVAENGVVYAIAAPPKILAARAEGHVPPPPTRGGYPDNKVSDTIIASYILAALRGASKGESLSASAVRTRVRRYAVVSQYRVARLLEVLREERKVRASDKEGTRYYATTA